MRSDEYCVKVRGMKRMNVIAINLTYRERTLYISQTYPLCYSWRINFLIRCSYRNAHSN